MVTIIRNDSMCKIDGEQETEIMQQLDRALSYKILGAEFSTAFKGYENVNGDFISWDGRKHLLLSSGRFAPGLFEKVFEFYKNKGIYVDIVDNRTPKTPLNKIDIIPRLQELKKNPRPYQLEAVEKAISTDRGIIRLPTGSGKSVVAALLTAAIGKKTIIYVIGTDLLYQMRDLFQQVFQTDIGIIGDGLCEIHDINIATVWSIAKALGQKESVSVDDGEEKEKKIDPAKFRKIKELLLSTKTHIYDECHLCSCASVLNISKNIKPEYIYGMSASPWRDDNSDILIESIVGRKIVDLTAKKLIEMGYLVRPDIRFIAPDAYPFKTGKYPKIYSKYIIENEQRNNLIVTATVKLVEQGFKVLTLFSAIKHGDILHEKISKKIPTALLSGHDSSKNREKIKEQFIEGKIKSISASKIFDIGVDIPDASGLICAGGGKSSVRALQRIGRVIRPAPNKDLAAIIDFADQAPYLFDHAERRKEIYSQEFDVKWPNLKK